MSTKKSLTVIITGTVLLLVGLFCLQQTSPVFAQCGDPQPSSCTTCHAQEDPVSNKGAWHSSHANEDICINCHGGNGTAMDKNLAHEGMVTQPLSDIYTDCHSCHPDYVERAVPFAATLQITPSSCATPTPVAVSNVSSGLPPSSMVLPSNLTSAASSSQPFLFIAGGLAVLAFFFFGLGWLERHHVKS